jgi:hypothetical protein
MNQRGAVMQSTEKKTITSLTIRGIERDLESTPKGRGGIISHKPATPGIGGSGTPGDNLLADWRELEAALTAERDRADRWLAVVAAVEKVLDDHAFDDEDGNGFVPIGPLQDALFGDEMPA